MKSTSLHSSLKRIGVIVLLLLLLFSGLKANLPAFPGAEGHGKYTTGGRGGRVINVTSLDDSNTPGTLRYAVSQTGPRIVLFKISGTITLNSQLDIRNDNITIAGQSAPGDGVCIKGYGFGCSANNVIIRYLRFRMGDVNDIESDALGGRQRKNIMIDHCSVSWSIDECCSFYDNQNFTMQWCIISESLRLSHHIKGPHGYGGIWGGRCATFHHNLLAHHDSRTPRFGSGVVNVGNDTVDYRNNVIYNWSGNGCYGAGGMKINMVNNYYKPGKATTTDYRRAKIIGIDKDVTSSNPTDPFYKLYNLWGRYYINGNYFDTSTSTTSTALSYLINVNNDNWTYGVYNMIASSYNITAQEKADLKLSAPLPTGEITTSTAQEAYEQVLAFSGCCKSRDDYDKRIINETRTGTAPYKGLSQYNGKGVVTYLPGTVIGSTTLTDTTTIDWKSLTYPKYGLIDSPTDFKLTGAAADWSPWPTLISATAPIDSDSDGMPDEWELANGLNPQNAGDAQGTSVDGRYPNIEVYLNSLVANITNKIPLALENNLQSDTGVVYCSDKKVIRVNSEEGVEKTYLYSVSGNCIRTFSGNEFNVSSLPYGVYIVKVGFISGKSISAKIALY